MDMSQAIGLSALRQPRPAWWPEGASFAADFVAHRYMKGGTSISEAGAYSVSRDTKRLANSASGHWNEFAANVPARTDLGLNILAAGVNGIRNSTMVGALVGTPGTLPTHWTFSGGAAGASYQIVGAGTVFGLPYVDLRVVGQTTSASGVAIRFDAHSVFAVAKDDQVNFSCLIGLADGTTTGFSFIRPCIVEHRANGTSTQTHYLTSIRDSIDAGLERLSVSRTITHAETASARAELEMTFAAGQSLDVTLRIAMPQLEFGTSASVPILTSGAVGGREADALTLHLPPGEHDLQFHFADGPDQTISGVGGDLTLNRSELGGGQIIAAYAVPA